MSDSYSTLGRPVDDDPFATLGTPVTTTGPARAAPEAGGLRQGITDLARVGSHELTFGMWPRVVGALESVTGGKPYGEAVAEQLALRKAAGERLGPLLTGTGEAIGGAAAPLGLAARGVALPVRAGAGLMERLGAAGAEGSLYGATQGAGNTYTGKLPDYIGAGGQGALLGGVLGVGAQGAGALAGRARQAAGDLFGQVPGYLSTAAQADRAGLQNVLNTPGGLLPDAGPSVLGVAQGAILGTGGEGRTALQTLSKARDDATVARMAAAREANLGRAEVPEFLARDIEGIPAAPGRPAQVGRMGMLGPDYEIAFNNARAIDNSALANRIESMIPDTRGETQAALQRIRGMLNVTGTSELDPHPRVLQAVRTEVRGMADNPDIPRALSRRLNDIYGDLTREMHAKIPGIRELDAQYAELASQANALKPRETGASIFDTGRGAVMRPEVFREELAQATQPKGPFFGPSAEAFRMRQAARAEYERIARTNPNDLMALGRVQGDPLDYNAEKMAIAFGPRQAAAERAMTEREKNFRNTYQKLFGGPETAQRLASKETQETGLGKIPLGTSLTGGALRLGQEALGAVQNRIMANTRDRIALQMAAQGSARDPIVAQWLAAQPARAAAANAVRGRVARAIMGAGTSLGADQ